MSLPAALLLALFRVQAPADLIHISDTHIAQLAGVHPAVAEARGIHRESLGKFERFIATVNQMPPVTLIHTGDVVDATCFDPAAGRRPVKGQIEAVRAAFALLRHPYHLALGNHDVECYRFDPARPANPAGDQSVAASARRQWRKQFAGLRARTYYSAPLPHGYRLFVLDNGHALTAPGGKQFFEKQMKWLAGELRRHRGQPAILALHVPLAADARSDMLKERLLQAGQVLLILCGHRHSPAVDWIELGPRKVLQVRTGALYQDAKAWRRVRLHPDRVELFAPGSDQIAETLPLPQRAAGTE